MADEPAIVVDHVTKRFRLYRERAGSLKELVTKRAGARYEDFTAVDDVSLEVPHGSVYGLVGHNGSGKSTLLKMMAAIHRPTSGSIRTSGRISALLELGAGFHPDLSGRENIYLNAAILGLHRREVDSIFDDIVDFSGLGSFVDSPVKHYSSGMFVRLGFSVAVHVNPQILIVDEVIAVGDEEFQRRCFEHLYKLRRQGVTIVMVTHSLNLVQAMCDQAAWLDHGQLKVVGTGDEVVQQYLAQVNDAEAHRLADERVKVAQEVEASMLHQPTLDHADRPVVLRSVEVLDGDDDPLSLTRPFTTVTVRLHYECREPVERPLFSFAVVNEHGVLVANPGMRSTPVEQVLIDRDGFVDYTIDRLLLGPGEYRIDAAIHDAHGTMAFDKHEDAASFVVRTSSSDDRVVGVTDLAGGWRLDRSEGPA
jgi:lipopolysaccharide transport system ATP-binding protein